MRACAHSSRVERLKGFSLLEVMIAIGIFFMVAFTVLALVSRCLRQAGALSKVRTPVGSLAAQTAATNQLEEGMESGDFEDLFPDYRWTREIYEITNGLYEVNLSVTRGSQGKPSDMTILLYRPQGVATGRRRPGRIGR